MIFEAKEIILKDGTKCILRSPTGDDAKEMLEYLKTCATETIFILRYPEECTETIEQEAQFLKTINNSEYNLMLVAEIDGEIAGNSQLAIHKRIKTRHRGDVAIALKQKFWNKGIGTIMFTELEKIARDKKCLQLELEVIEGNTRAISFYEKMNYSIYAKRSRGIILKDGTALSEYFMVKFLD